MRTCFLLLLISISFITVAQDFPPGWRMANQSELSGRSSSTTRIDADFNGDSINDTAYVLKSTDFSGEGLLVHLSSENGHQWKTLERINWGPDYPNANLAMAVDVAEANNYLTACGKGQWQCDEYETAEFCTAFAGIWYYRFGGHKSLFYWNPEKQKFDKQWISN